MLAEVATGPKLNIGKHICADPGDDLNSDESRARYFKLLGAYSWNLRGMKSVRANVCVLLEIHTQWYIVTAGQVNSDSAGLAEICGILVIPFKVSITKAGGLLIETA